MMIMMMIMMAEMGNADADNTETRMIDMTMTTYMDNEVGDKDARDDDNEIDDKDG